MNVSLIPRPETEILVETVLKNAHDKQYSNRKITIMDIGTGSGNIAVSLAKNLSNVEIYASDISQEALEVAKENVQRHQCCRQGYISCTEISRCIH
jgi:release factor glutamine methyltransferase